MVLDSFAHVSHPPALLFQLLLGTLARDIHYVATTTQHESVWNLIIQFFIFLFWDSCFYLGLLSFFLYDV